MLLRLVWRYVVMFLCWWWYCWWCLVSLIVRWLCELVYVEWIGSLWYFKVFFCFSMLDFWWVWVFVYVVNCWSDMVWCWWLIYYWWSFFCWCVYLGIWVGWWWDWDCLVVLGWCVWFWFVWLGVYWYWWCLFCVDRSGRCVVLKDLWCVWLNIWCFWLLWFVYYGILYLVVIWIFRWLDWVCVMIVLG